MLADMKLRPASGRISDLSCSSFSRASLRVRPTIGTIPGSTLTASAGRPFSVTFCLKLL